MNFNETSLIPKQTVETLTNAHSEIMGMVEQGLRTLAAAQSLMRDTLGGCNNIIERELHPFNLGKSSIENLIKDNKKHIEACFWDYAQKQVGIRDLMGSRDRNIWDDAIGKRTVPPFTTENVIETIQALVGDIDGIFKRAVLECFDKFRPRSYGRKHVTNKVEMIGPKVIVEGAISGSYINQYAQGKLVDLCRVFHGLDGKRAAKYGEEDSLTTAIIAAIRDHQCDCSTPYFECKWYKNGNLHICFKRLDLLAKLNEIGSNGSTSVGI